MHFRCVGGNMQRVLQNVGITRIKVTQSAYECASSKIDVDSRAERGPAVERLELVGRLLVPLGVGVGPGLGVVGPTPTF